MLDKTVTFTNFTYHIVNIKLSLNTLIFDPSIHFTYHIVNIKLFEYGDKVKIILPFTYHIVNIKLSVDKDSIVVRGALHTT
ncbi:hypothetical protein HMPREF0220_1610 [Clostridioides difficile NAP08]|uniref:Uncharacterized protein n=1 Tax=Clostridioides difficile NAP08 TaxID=525259 RepID=D5Q3X8_CLODI|nr:hypothetical protein HMPREF0220_1610 [Clostridioides difficile NAP08]EFH15664.1 hypothetical protein HMPREF0219_1787 [Clostridioides difficile NAP07]